MQIGVHKNTDERKLTRRDKETEISRLESKV